MKKHIKKWKEEINLTVATVGTLTTILTFIEKLSALFTRETHRVSAQLSQSASDVGVKSMDYAAQSMSYSSRHTGFPWLIVILGIVVIAFIVFLGFSLVKLYNKYMVRS